ncbi:hypothetical protein ABPG72_007828 [Tetrahymena utriculariae]
MSNFTNIFSSSKNLYAISILQEFSFYSSVQKYFKSSITELQNNSLNNITFEDVQVQNSFGGVNSAFMNLVNCKVVMQRIQVSQNQQLVQISSQFDWAILQQISLFKHNILRQVLAIVNLRNYSVYLNMLTHFQYNLLTQMFSFLIPQSQNHLLLKTLLIQILGFYQQIIQNFKVLLILSKHLDLFSKQIQNINKIIKIL